MSNILSEVHPELVAEWSDKNLPLTPYKITYGSNKVVWWKGACGHEWKTSVKARSNGENCPICSGARVIEGINDLATLKPALAAEWSSKNDPLKPTMVTIGSHKKVIWQDKYGHEWTATVKSRALNGTGCPYCSHNKILVGFNDLASQRPQIASEWSERNYPLKPDMVTVFANQKVWWRCSKGHEWNTLISTRSGGSGCPYCSGQLLLKGFNDFATTHPQLAQEWSDRNLPLTPDMINEKSRRNVWWKCKECGYEWQSVVYLKSAGSFADAKESERDTLICDENGFAQTKDMPYGTYTVHQVSGWEGRELMDDFDVFIAKDAQTYRYLINNSNFESYIQVVKVDAETGKTIPYAGAGFQIYDPSGNLITMEFTYPTPTTVDTFYTDANGSLVTPEKLPYGQGFSIVEVQSPYGYVLDSTPVYFDVTEENSSEESGVTVIKVEKTNMPQKGTISIEKTGEVFFGVSVSGGTDENGQELPVIYQPIYETQGLPDTVYEIRAAEDVVTPDGTLRYSKGELVDTVTTDETGFAKSKELYLGKYEVKEVKAGYGMVLSSEVHTLRFPL